MDLPDVEKSCLRLNARTYCGSVGEFQALLLPSGQSVVAYIQPDSNVFSDHNFEPWEHQHSHRSLLAGASFGFGTDILGINGDKQKKKSEKERGGEKKESSVEQLGQ
ncbi:hypothetical protein FB451DRAFT_1170118 [Mycena latifolia]|nr:hypothetical protein FB451DRAFT_1170118 [Mycena latifolia]